MTRALNADFQTQLRSVDPKPIVLLEIATGLTAAGSTHIRMTSDDHATVFPTTGGSTFAARPFQCSEAQVDADESGGIEVTIPDVDFAVDTYLLSTDFRFSLVNRYIVERDSLDSSAKAIMDTFRVTSRSRQDRVVTFRAEPLCAVFSRVTLPRRKLSREEFPALPDYGVS
jgi:hypothetical protein